VQFKNGPVVKNNRVLFQYKHVTNQNIIQGFVLIFILPLPVAVLQLVSSTYLYLQDVLKYDLCLFSFKQEETNSISLNTARVLTKRNVVSTSNSFRTCFIVL